MTISPDRAVYVSLDELTTPKHGATAYTDCWWAVDPERGAIFYRRGQGIPLAPQCNRDKNVADVVVSRIWPGAEVRHIPVAYVVDRR